MVIEPVVFGSYTAAQLEAQYNNRAAVPEHTGIIASWERDSDRFRSSVACQLDLAYAEHPRARLDLFLCGQPDAPLHLFIHGGYWRAMDKRHFSFMAKPLVESGVSVAIASYALCPEVTIDLIAEQLRACCVWLWRKAMAFGYSAAGVHVSGHSAGGHLAAALRATRWEQVAGDVPADLIRSAVSISGVFELEPLCYTSINQDLRMDLETARRNSVMDATPTGSAPVVVLVGGQESGEFLRQSETFAKRWSALGVPVDHRVLDGLNHFTILTELARPNGLLSQLMMENR